MNNEGVRGFQLSICIPTFNRAEAVTRLVKKILSVDDAGIEVVVLDNGSTDATMDRLSALSNPRLSVYGNGINRGVLFNILHAVDRAQGNYAVMLLDKDDIDPSLITPFKDYLNARSNLACGYCEYRSGGKLEALVYATGMPALRRIAYVGRHPTGYFFNTRLLRTLEMTARFSDFNFVGHFPFDFIFAELLVQGEGAAYQRPVFSPETLEVAAKHKSVGTNASSENAFFSPEGRLQTAINFCRHIQTLTIPEEQQKALMVDRFIQGIVSATLGYRSVMADERLCLHYHTARREIGIAETLKVARNFHRRFIRAVVVEPESGRASWALQFHVDILKSVGVRIGRRLWPRAG